MDAIRVKAWQRKREIARKLGELSELGLTTNLPFNHSAFEEYVDGEYDEEGEYSWLVSFLGYEEINQEDPENPVCRCDNLYSFSTYFWGMPEDYEKLISNCAQLAGDDLELGLATARLEFDPPIEDFDTVTLYSQASLRELGAEVATALVSAKLAAIDAGQATARISIEANGKLANLVFQQEWPMLDFCVLRCLAALARLRTDERQFFVVSLEAEEATVGYLPRVQITQLRDLGVYTDEVRATLPLPAYTVADAKPSHS